MYQDALIDKKTVVEKIHAFLQEKAKKKFQEHEKKLKKISNPIKQQLDTEKQRIATHNEYQLDNWMSKAAFEFAKGINIATHIAKGIHSSSRGAIVNSIHYFNAKCKDPIDSYCGSHIIEATPDSSGNAKCLQLASLLLLEIAEDSNKNNKVRLKDLIIKDDPSIDGVFATDKELSKKYQEIFKSVCCDNKPNNIIDKYLKQLLWPLNEDNTSDPSIVKNAYRCLIPLFPSSLVYALFTHINDGIKNGANEENRKLRFSTNSSTTNKKSQLAKNNQHGVNYVSYIDLPNLAIVKHGGSNPQNISKLTSRMQGRNYLLPSLPPPILTNKRYVITQSVTTIFNKSLQYACQEAFDELFQVVGQRQSTKEIREAREQAIQSIIDTLFVQWHAIQDDERYPSGWSKKYNLSNEQKIWLDYQLRKDMIAENERSIDNNWPKIIAQRFASWINRVLQKQFSERKHEFGDAEYEECYKNIKERIKLSLRNNEDIFEGGAIDE